MRAHQSLKERSIVAVEPLTKSTTQCHKTSYIQVQPTLCFKGKGDSTFHEQHKHQKRDQERAAANTLHTKSEMEQFNNKVNTKIEN